VIDFELTDEQRLVKETAREFADNEIAPRARENDRHERFDTELVEKLAGMGFLGPIIAEEYGGRGIDYRTYGLIVEEIGRADSSARTVISVVTSLVGSSIERWGSEDQKQEWLPRLCSGELGCFGLTEPGTGSDAANLSTRATKVNGGWRISGQKMFISLGNYSKLALVFAQTDPDQGHRGIACFLVPCDADGFSSQEIHGKLGLRASDTAELALDGVEVPDEAMLGEVGDGFKIAMSALDSGRFSVAAGCVGICQGCIDASLTYSKEREQFGTAIASFQLVQEMLADMVVDTDAARSLVWRAGWLKDTGQPNTTETSIAKLYATEAAVRCANTAIQVHGGSGYVDDYPVERYLRDARVTTLYEGTSQIQKLIIGRDLTGVNALTPAERRVCEMAADGELTNRAIAQNLFVTEKTVELHLTSAYRKLGIRSRFQLAGALGA
jgi:alkylation response protein AidB-like acyl-CoA dehydrogenase